MFASIKNLKFCFPSDGPIISSSSPSLINVNVNERLIIECNYTGFPPPDIVWKLNGTHITRNKYSSVHICTNKAASNGSSQLIWFNASPMQARGTYCCCVANGVGIANKTFIVHVEGKYKYKFLSHFLNYNNNNDLAE